MKNVNAKVMAAAIVVVLALSLGGYLYSNSGTRDKDRAPTPPAAGEAAQATPSDASAKYPISNIDEPQGKIKSTSSEGETPSAPQEAPPPRGDARGDASDSPFLDEVSALIGAERVAAIINPQDLIRHIVISVENSGGRQLPQQFSPFKPLESQFEVSGDADTPNLSPSNFTRYSAVMDVIKSSNLTNLLKIYRRYYPLFQAAYHEVGMKGYFNDRVVQVIDSLIDTPNVEGPIKLILEGNHYKFAESRLEALTGAQKVLVRIGPENEALIKDRLREVRRILTRARG